MNLVLPHLMCLIDVWLVYGGSIDYEIIGFDNSNNRKDLETGI